MLILLLLVPAAAAIALMVWIMTAGHPDLAPVALIVAAAIPATYAIYHAVRFRSRADGAMRMTYGLMAAAMLWVLLAR
ncbi:MAG TPA: hypothetical protein VFY65_15450 [Longimicrobium sp.]|nr:hypothetical protein [Longimicrobium sp.]